MNQDHHKLQDAIAEIAQGKGGSVCEGCHGGGVVKDADCPMCCGSGIAAKSGKEAASTSAVKMVTK